VIPALGLLFDQLIYALLLKIMDLKVVLTSTFQPLVLFLVTFFYGFVFFFLMIKNGFMSVTSPNTINSMIIMIKR